MTTRFALALSVDNDAFQDGNRNAETARILTGVAARITDTTDTEGAVRDVNGNTVGMWTDAAEYAPKAQAGTFTMVATFDDRYELAQIIKNAAHVIDSGNEFDEASIVHPTPAGDITTRGHWQFTPDDRDLHIELADPDDVDFGMPAYEGALDAAGQHLDAGTYPGVSAYPTFGSPMTGTLTIDAHGVATFTKD